MKYHCETNNHYLIGASTFEIWVLILVLGPQVQVLVLVLVLGPQVLVLVIILRPQVLVLVLVASQIPFPWGTGARLIQYYLYYLTTQMSLPSGISFRPTALAGCTLHKCDRRTDGHHATVTSVAVVGVTFSNAAMPPKTDQFLMGLWQKVGG